MKKALSLALVIVMLGAFSAFFSGCSVSGSKEYPVEVNGVTVTAEPKNIVVLSDNLADIISYIGYDVKMVGKSVDCDQAFLSVVPSVGMAENPALDMIEQYETDFVVAEDTLPEKVKKKLNDMDITVVTFSDAKSFEELSTLYENLGAVLGGNVTGRKKGADAYAELIKTFDTFSGSVSSKVVVTDVYLYMNEEGELCSFTKGSVENELMAYNNAVNVLANDEEAVVDHDTLRMGTPTYIFYDGESVLEYLRNDESLSNLTALKEGRTCQIPLVDFSRQGVTYEETVFKMMELMFIKSTADEATPDEVADAAY